MQSRADLKPRRPVIRWNARKRAPQVFFLFAGINPLRRRGSCFRGCLHRNDVGDRRDAVQSLTFFKRRDELIPVVDKGLRWETNVDHERLTFLMHEASQSHHMRQVANRGVAACQCREALLEGRELFQRNACHVPIEMKPIRACFRTA